MTQPRSSGRAALATTGALLLLATVGMSASSATEAACATFKWSLAREQAWLAGPLSDHAAIGPEGGAVRLALADAKSVAFQVPPEKPAAAGTYGSLLTLDHLAAGTYQVTLSAEAWIDMVQARERVPSIDFSGVKGCPGLRKSVRFRLADGPATLQISGAPQATIDVAVAPAR